MDQLSHDIPLDSPTGRRTDYKRLCNSSKQAISTPANSYIAAILEEKRRRTLVLRNVPEAENAIPSCRQQADEALTASVLDTMDMQVRPIAVFRLGERTPDKPRFLMIELPTRSHLVEALRNGRLLKDSDYNHIFVGQSMTAEERRKWSLQRSKRRRPSSPVSPPLPAQPPATPPLPAQPPATPPPEEANPIRQEALALFDTLNTANSTFTSSADAHRKAINVILVCHRMYNFVVNACQVYLEHGRALTTPPPVPPQLNAAYIRDHPETDYNAAFAAWSSEVFSWAAANNIKLPNNLS